MQQSHCLETSLDSISILLVSPYQKDHTNLRHVLHHADWKITRASDLGEATLILHERAPSVILCERDLPDGNWKDLLDQAAQHKNPAMVLVISAHADNGLWAEVLNLGGYDVLMKPFDVSEVTRVVRMAWQRWRGRTLKKEARSATAFEEWAAAHA
jgi:DNA-binding response OmpR family regulator